MGPPGIPRPRRHGGTKEIWQAPADATQNAVNLVRLDQRAMMIERGGAGLGDAEKGGGQFTCLADEVDRIRDQLASAGILLLDLDPELVAERVAERRTLTTSKPVRGVERKGFEKRRQRVAVRVGPLVNGAYGFADCGSGAFPFDLRENLDHRVGKAVGDARLGHSEAFLWKTADRLQSTAAASAITSSVSG